MNINNSVSLLNSKDRRSIPEYSWRNEGPLSRIAEPFRLFALPELEAELHITLLGGGDLRLEPKD